MTSNGEKRILLSILGDDPQMLIQSVGALARLDDPWVPHEIRAIGLEDDGARAREQLFTKQASYDLLASAGVGYIDFSPDKITAVKLSDKHAALPIDCANAERLGDAIFRELLKITGKDHHRVHTVLASNSHVMSLLAASATAILSRPVDRLSRLVAADNYRLQPIPFLRLSKLVALRMVFENDIEFSALRRVLEDEPSLKIYSGGSAVCIKLSDAIEIPCDARHSLTKRRMQPRSAALYILYARRRLAGHGPMTDDELLDDPAEYLKIYGDLLFGEAHSTRESKEDRELTGKAVCTARTRINSALRRVLPQGEIYSAYRVHRDKETRGYELRLPPEQVSVAPFN